MIGVLATQNNVDEKKYILYMSRSGTLTKKSKHRNTHDNRNQQSKVITSRLASSFYIQEEQYTDI